MQLRRRQEHRHDAAIDRPATPAKLTDIDHVVIFFQENRSFDQYFGTRPGVLGFGDPNVVKGESGRPAWYQPTPLHPAGYLLPFRLDSRTTSGQCAPDVSHSWEDQHAARNGGHMDGFVRHMGADAVGYFAPDDLPYYRAVADEFTVCDHYHCSVLGPTNPNRYYSMTGTIDPAGTGGGPAIDNGTRPWRWETYPERLQRAGISWRVYHDADDYDDNCLKFFANFQGLPETDPLWQNALRNRKVADFAADVKSGNLPQVSWIVAPTALSEHPPYPPAAGEDLTHQYLGALLGTPKVWARTVFIWSMDENGGFFDHVPPPVPEPGTANEFVRGEPIGLGFRVPTIVASPWSRGGRVCHDVFDHTSTLRFVEKRFGVEVPNLTEWRRQTCGDLTSALDLSHTDRTVPSLPDTAAQLAAVTASCRLPAAVPPAEQSLPRVG